LSNGEVNFEPVFSIYPNPTSTNITLEIPATPITKTTFLTIYNINGQALISRQITEQQAIVDVSGLSKGLYYVKITDEKTVMMGKFVKQ
jgi:hypothetical protein